MRTLLTLMLLVPFAGCDDGNPFDYVPVKGRLTYDDGKPIPAKGMRIGFTVQDVPPRDGAFPRPAEAVVGAEGWFDSVTSYRPGDGLVPGRHKVAIYYATDDDGNLLIAKDYSHASSTPLVVEIDESSSDTPLEIKVPRSSAPRK